MSDRQQVAPKSDDRENFAPWMSNSGEPGLSLEVIVIIFNFKCVMLTYFVCDEVGRASLLII